MWLCEFQILFEAIFFFLRTADRQIWQFDSFQNFGIKSKENWYCFTKFLLYICISMCMCVYTHVCVGVFQVKDPYIWS